ncbi:MAG: valine--tRNA ligase [Clostridia bacterium]|nr:valine--tRNA ligase [Clostridia bacterium]
MRKELAKNYAPREFEDRIYKNWCDKNYFAPDPDKKKPAFSIVIPPPNVTGQLHMGHALDETLQDILVRTKRMQGYSALWVPGTDHAGIATQIKVEENLRVNEGLTRYDLGREKFLERVWDWKNQYGTRIINQLKKLGASCDWNRERFTMDEGCSKAVREVFVNLYNKGLIYRGYRIINWCPRCLTALSDAEVEYAEQPGSFWHVRYPIDGTDEYLTVATTRPETMLGDTAVAVHPEDERYAHLVGKTLTLPLVGRKIPIIADEYVERDFGTGCVKITPAHDPNDFEVGKRHNLEIIKVMNDDATINSEYGGKYAGMDRYEARKVMVADLEAGGFLVKVEPCAHNVGTCYRCKTTVEPMTSDQWFVKMEPLAKPALEVVKSGEIKFEPERFTKTYTNWMENCHDWCISRQLWWGHRIPAFYCDECGEMTVSKEDISVCPKCGAPVRQEEDVLDTWFSSALWPFSTMGWPEKTEDLARYYPTSVLVTGYDIIFFWVARMIFSGMEHMGEKPFSTVFIHGLVRDAQGRKMSKSLGNGIDPLKVIDEYGADALRFALATGNAPGNDMRFSDEKIEAARNFANKLWNASRFVLMNLTEEDEELLKAPKDSELTIEDKWILARLNELTKSVNANIDNYELGIALGDIYSFTWDLFCDWYIEMAKSRIFDTGSPAALTAKRVLVKVLTDILKLLHPYMPFITEEIYQALPHTDESIVISAFPKYDEKLSYKTEEEDVDRIIGCIVAIRARRSEMNVPPSKKAKLFVVTKYEETFKTTAKILEKLASASEVIVTDSYDSDDAVAIATDAGTVYIPLAEVIDFEKERARLTAEAKKNDSEIERIEKKLANEGFVSKAPAAVIEGERAKLAKYLETRESLKAALAKLG